MANLKAKEAQDATSRTPSILFVDAYDSFSRNIVALLYSSVPSADIVIIHIDTDVQQIYGVDLREFTSSFDAIILGPGPGDPRVQSDVGLFEHILAIAAASHIPVLGICLGFQSLCLYYGHSITPLPVPCHGQTKIIRSTGTGIFENLQCRQDVRMRSYNSLGVLRSEFLLSDEDRSSSSAGTSTSASSSTSSPAFLRPLQLDKASELDLLAWDDDGFAMAVKHPMLPLWGLQFHPESCMCNDGADLVKDWWSQAESYVRRRKLETYSGGSSHSSHARRQQRDRCIESNLPGIEIQDSRSTIGKVTWIMEKFKSITARRLSKFCHDQAGKGACAIFESAAKGRYCIYAFPEVNHEVVEYAEGKLISRRGLSIYRQKPMSPFKALDDVKSRTKSRACSNGCSAIPFWGGWMGFCSYEMGLDLINVKTTRKRIVPDFSFLFVERSVVFDQQNGNICVQSIKEDDEAWVKGMMQRLGTLDQMAGWGKSKHQSSSLEDVFASIKISVPNHDEYTDKIRACQDQLHAGNSYELCLTSEARIDAPAPNFDVSYALYQNLIKHNPVPFAAYLHFPSSMSSSSKADATPNGTTILSSSPEQFISWSRNGTLDMIPMKGTVQRTPTTTIDDAYRILGSPKETAENLMIADLIRHDLYGVVGCRPYAWVNASHGSGCEEHATLCSLPSEEDSDGRTIAGRTQKNGRADRDPLSIPALNAIKQFDTVFQLVSHIRANPPPHVNANDFESVIEHNHSSLHHVLPPGSMTGAPKKRSCEILQQLEQRNRGVYSGIIGYMDVGGGGCWSVAIRTAFSSQAEDYLVEKTVGANDRDEDMVEIEKRRIWHVGAGGAVTVLSDVQGEWEEMMGKMNNVLKGFREVKEEMPTWRSERA